LLGDGEQAVKKTAGRTANRNLELGAEFIDPTQRITPPKNGHNRVVPLLNSTSTSGVRSDGELYPLTQTKNEFDRKGLPDATRLPPPQSVAIEPVPLNFGEFSDGTRVELVRSSTHVGQLRFLIWKAGEFKLADSFCYDGTQFVLPRFDTSLLSATRLPTGITAGGDAAELLDGIAQSISEYVELSPNHVRLVANFVLSTWFQDRLSVAPYLWVIGPYSAGKTRLLSLLHALCRRALMASDISPAALYSVPDALMPTLLIDEFETGSRAVDRDRLRLLRSGSTPDGHVIRGSKVYGTFCAKVIVSRQEPSDVALASRAIFIPMVPTRRVLPCLDTAVLQQIADRFQPQLLHYRLKSYGAAITRHRRQVAEFTPRIRDLALAFAAPLLEDPDLEAQLFADLAAEDTEAKLARHAEPEWVVATALYRECHATRGTLTVGNLTCTVSDVLLGNDETYQLSPRKVGEILRSLGLHTEKLGNQGRGFRLTNEFVSRVHKLALQLGINRSHILPYTTVDAGYAGPPCSFCDDFGLLERNDGTKLRSVASGIPRRRRGLYG
jgi:hypothetical protein